MCFQPLRHCFDCNLRGILQRVAIHAGRIARERNAMDIMLFGKVQRLAVAVRQLRGILCCAGINRAYRMNDITLLSLVALSDFCFAGAAAVQRTTLRQQFRPCCPVDGTIHTAATAIVVVVSAAATAAGRAAEVAVERRHVLGIARIAFAEVAIITV